MEVAVNCMTVHTKVVEWLFSVTKHILAVGIKYKFMQTIDQINTLILVQF